LEVVLLPKEHYNGFSLKELINKIKKLRQKLAEKDKRKKKRHCKTKAMEAF
jgi:hypothetical protein